MNWDNSLSTSASIAIQRTLCVCWKVIWTIWWKTTSGEDTNKMSQGTWHWSGYKTSSISTIKQWKIFHYRFLIFSSSTNSFKNNWAKQTKTPDKKSGWWVKWWWQSLTIVNGQFLIKSWLPQMTLTTYSSDLFSGWSSNITALQGQGKNVIAVALTGIASTLLIGGATYHSSFTHPWQRPPDPRLKQGATLHNWSEEPIL